MADIGEIAVQLKIEATQFKRELAKANSELDALQKEAEKAGGVTDELASQMRDAAKRVLGLEDALADTNKKLKDTGRGASEAAKSTSKLGDSLKAAGGALAGAFAVDQVLQLGKEMVNVTAQFETYNAVLRNSLGSQEAAALAMSRIKSVATTTPYDVGQITEAFILLSNRGVVPTEQSMKNMADVAAFTGKDVKQLVEAIGDINNTERWAEFGIKAETAGNKIKGTFKGVTIEFDRSTAGALSFVDALSKIEGVAGTTDAVAETLQGRMSMLGDAWTSFLNTIGSGNSGVLKDTVALLTSLVEAMGKAAETTAQANERLASGPLSKIREQYGDINKMTKEQAQAELQRATAAEKAAQAEVKKQQQILDAARKANVAAAGRAGSFAPVGGVGAMAVQAGSTSQNELAKNQAIQQQLAAKMRIAEAEGRIKQLNGQQEESQKKLSEEAKKQATELQKSYEAVNKALQIAQNQSLVGATNRDIEEDMLRVLNSQIPVLAEKYGIEAKITQDMLKRRDAILSIGRAGQAAVLGTRVEGAQASSIAMPSMPQFKIPENAKKELADWQANYQTWLNGNAEMTEKQNAIMLSSFTTLGQGIASAFTSGEDAGEALIRTLVNVGVQLAAQLALLAAFGAATGGAATAGSGLLSGLLGGLAGGFKFAAGGIVQPGASNRIAERGVPEAVLPLDRLYTMMSMQRVQVGGEFTIAGNSLVAGVQNFDRFRSRATGLSQITR